MDISLSQCETLDDFNKFMSNNVKVIAGAHTGRKFQIAGKNYTMNQIFMRFIICAQQDAKAGQLDVQKKKAGFTKVQALHESGKEKIASKLKEGKLSKAGAFVIKIRQAFGNLWLKDLAAFDKKKLLNAVHKGLVDKHILTEKEFRTAVDFEKRKISDTAQLQQEVKKILKDVIASPIPSTAFSRLDRPQLLKLKLNLFAMQEKLDGRKLHLQEPQKKAVGTLLESISNSKFEEDWDIEKGAKKPYLRFISETYEVA